MRWTRPLMAAMITCRVALPVDAGGRVLEADLEYRGFPDLGRLGLRDADRIGGPAAALSEGARRPGNHLPRGFAIPFAEFTDFLHENRLAADLERTLGEAAGPDPSPDRLRALAGLREAIRSGAHTRQFRTRFLRVLRERYPGSRFQVSTSGNAAPPPGGPAPLLEATVGQVHGAEALLDAVKEAWARLYTPPRVTPGTLPAVLLIETTGAGR